MTTAFSRAEARLGASTRRRLGNATASFSGAPAVDGIFDDRPSIATVGPSGMQAREYQFIGASAEVGALQEGEPVIVVKAGATQTFRVALAEVDTHLGNTTVQLTRAE
jgi:hypothetical protein